MQHGWALSIRIGIKLSPQLVAWNVLEEAWRAAGESESFDSMWTFDHLYALNGQGGSFEGFTTLAVLAHHSGDKQVGHLVLAATYRHPGLLAKMATVMDHATDGRFVLGLGAGWFEPETDAFGLPLPPVPERMRYLESVLRVVRPLLLATDKGAPPMVSVEAPPFSLRDARNDPPPLRSGPPIWIGTEGERVGLRLVAELADGWNHSAARGVDVDGFRRRLGVLARHCDAFGRDIGDIEVSVQLPVQPGDDGHRAAREAGRAYLDAGCRHLVLIVNANGGPTEIAAVAREVADPLR
jgi:alkanesulfonate monooxygenase SsuD/methylene tetrahydromethanopterin reductase-like flavin-dependent oxidoreductase (luciferase family)